MFWKVLFPYDADGQTYLQSNRFIDSKFFSDEKITIDSSVTYGVAIDWLGVADTQKFNIAYPKLNIDTLQRRPFVMLMHGGGYHTEDDFSNKNQWNDLCVLLAKRGFVAATIDYRVGWKDPDDDWNPKGKIEPTAVNAVYRAFQDARAALRYFVHNAFVYGIDTNNIFIGGRSAGGDISLHTAFLSQQNIDSLISTIGLDCHKAFGSLDSSTNSLTEKYKIRGVINMWGPIPDTAFIDPSEAQAIPIIMFHGTDDKSVPYKKFCPPDYPYTRYGSFFIAQRYKNLGCCYQLHTKIGGGHGEDFDNDFLADHISSFLKNVLCSTCKSEEFESEVSFRWKFERFFSSGDYLNFVAIILLILIAVFVIRVIKKRKRKK